MLIIGEADLLASISLARDRLDTRVASGNHRGMKIYTKTGDDGTTGLFGGGRIRKSDPRIECYGTIDELNASIGLATAVVDEEMQNWLRQIQHELFNIGSHLATSAE